VYVRPPNAGERMRGEPAVTQFGRMCAKLGIGIIAASSPPAKGRVERAHGTHQDRLVKKLRLAGIANYGQANAYLDEHYLTEHNRRYARPAAEAADYHRRPTTRQLDEVFWLEEERAPSRVRLNSNVIPRNKLWKSIPGIRCVLRRSMLHRRFAVLDLQTITARQRACHAPSSRRRRRRSGHGYSQRRSR
jgi:hypothetical protein